MYYPSTMTSMHTRTCDMNKVAVNIQENTCMRTPINSTWHLIENNQIVPPNNTMYENGGMCLREDGREIEIVHADFV